MSGPQAPTGTEASVCADIAARQALGLRKYGQTVAQNPLELKAWLQHAYEEALDLAVYLKRAIEEVDRNGQAMGMLCASIDEALNSGDGSHRP